MIVNGVEQRFGDVRAPQQVQWLTDTVAEAYVKTFKHDVRGNPIPDVLGRDRDGRPTTHRAQQIRNSRPKRLVRDHPDRSQRIIPPNYLLQVDVARQLARSIVVAAHASSPNLHWSR